MQQLERIYVPISVKDGVPKVECSWSVLCDEGLQQRCLINKEWRIYDENAEHYTIDYSVTHWLKPVDNVIVCSVEDLKDLFFDGIESAPRFIHPTMSAPKEMADIFVNHLKSKGVEI